MVVNIDPIIFTLGPLQVRWYGLMYVLGFVIASFLMKKMARENLFKIDPKKVDTLITYLIIGMLIGARIFYVFIYNWDYYSENMDEIMAVWKGGLSFHGALTGMLVAMYLFGRVNKLHFFQVTDWVAVSAGPGLFFGRLGNFINGELWGRVTDVPWAMIFPSGGPYPRHPSQLYEALAEGLLLFGVLWFLRKRVPYNGILTLIFMAGYALIRIVVEFFREPDEQLGFFFGGHITMGQILSLVMALVGLVFFYFAHKKKIKI
jgi:phosphatidylglycerol---prolipoprotein diacylglyceryl transferase